MNPLETDLEELAALRGSRAVAKETSGYPALANLFNAVGHLLKPKVSCCIHPRNSGAGLPDGGFFTPDQIKNTDEEKPLLGVPQPSRGVVEVKSTGDELDDIAKTKQVAAYLQHYGLLLLTNYREFLLLSGRIGRAFCCRIRKPRCWPPPNWASKLPHCSTRKRPLTA